MYSGSCHVNFPFAYGAFTLSGWLSQNHSARIIESIMQSEPHGARTMVWALPRSLAATYGIDVSFSSSGYLDVSVHRVPGVWLCIHHTSLEVHSSRFPHSEISGSKDICSSPKLIAAYHVFHRLLVPRHPPCALSSLTRCLFAAGTALKTKVHSVAPLAVCLHFSVCISFDMPRMSCILNIYLRSFIQYAVFKVQSVCSLS